MTMNWKLIAALACGTALLLGACSSNNPTGTSSGGTGTGGTGTTTDGNGDGDGGGDGGTESSELQEARTAYTNARTAVSRATMAAQDATTEEDRAEARRLVGLARAAITDAVNKAQAAVDAVGAGAEYDEARGNAITFQNTVTAYQRAELPKLVAAEGPLFWFNGELVRRAIADGSVRVPADGENKLRGPNDGIRRTSRTKDTSATDTTQIANTEPLTVKSADFKAIMYADGKEVFSVSDDAEGGDEFRVDGYVSPLHSSVDADFALKTGLKMTADGPEIRTGGTVIAAAAGGGRPPDSAIIGGLHGNYLDLRKKVTQGIGAGALDTAGWDLLIKFDEPQTRSAASVAAPRGITSWAGNSEFHWRAVARPDPRQLDPAQTDYYAAGTFTQLKGYERLGTYDLVLSNLVDVDRRLEPVSGSGLPANPDDDENYYLKYAAYGIFRFEADPMLGGFATNNELSRYSRVQAMHFGYEAFKDETGKKTTDIGKALDGTFRGMTSAFAFKGTKFSGATGGTEDFESKQLRGDVELKVTIPKSTGSGTLIGTMSNFEEWNGQYWKAYSDTFKIAFDNGTVDTAMSIGDDGKFTGKARLTAGAADALTAGATGTVNESGIGEVTGSFYGPKDDADDLEIAGSWVLGHLSGTVGRLSTKWNVVGSFGAKQRPAATSSSN